MRRRRQRPLSAILGVAGLLTAALPIHAVGAESAAGEAVVAIVGDAGINVLHEQFRLEPGQSLTVPDAAGPVHWIDLPESGTFEERLAVVRAGPLGAMDANTLYGVRGTRLLLKAPIHGYDMLARADHGTPVAGALGGTTTGSNPDALIVFAVGNNVPTWSWLSDQQWIDLSTTSVGSVATACQTATALVNEVIDSGRVVFSSGGNGGHHYLSYTAYPMNVPRVYRVGEAVYQPHQPNHVDSRDYGGADLPTEDSDTRLRYSGGTSFAAPRTAGRAAALLQHARSVLASHATGIADGRYATGAGPAAGPLADGDFTGEELRTLLRAVARPQFGALDQRYWIEGYGVLDDAAIDHARRILDGDEPLPQRVEDVDHRRDQQVREQVRPCVLPDNEGALTGAR